MPAISRRQLSQQMQDTRSFCSCYLAKFWKV